MQTRHLLHAAVILSAFSLQAFRLFSQQVAPPAATTTGTATVPVVTTTGAAAPSAPDDEVIQLSPFTVTGAADRGFEAINTTSGSRVRTPLRDTAASITAFTNEQLDAIGASSIDDIMTYTPNTEADNDDAEQTFSSLATRGAGNADNRYRIRGLPMGTALNYVSISFPINRYNIERTEVSSGANSILFGMAPAGGVVNFTTAQANLQRSRLSVRQHIGTWTGTPNHGIPYAQSWLDYNIVLAPRAAALRILGLYQDGGNNSWRYYAALHEKRINPVVTLRPFKNTTINAAYETGRRQDTPTINWNLSDGYTAWANAGANPVTTFADVNNTMTPAGLQQFTPGVNAGPYFVLVDNTAPNATPALYNYHRAFGGLKAGGANGVRLPSNISSYYYNTVGPGGRRDQKFDRFDITLDQTIGKLNLQIGYYHNKNDSTAFAPYSNQSEIKIDPNSYISPPTWTGAAGTLENPNAMRYYVEDTWQKNIVNVSYDTFRVTGEYTLNLKQFGRHRIVGLYEHSASEQLQRILLEIYADENQVPYNISATSLNNTNTNVTGALLNRVNRRQYITWGDFTTYYSGDLNIPAPDFVSGLHTYHSTWANQTQNMVHVKSQTNSGMVVLQSYFLKDRLATTLGYRLDDLSYKLENYYQVFDANDPHILNKTAVLNESVFNGTWSDPQKYTPYTFTAGAVYHLLDWLSPFINYSTNRGQPYMDNRRVLLTTDATNAANVAGLAPLSQGHSIDYGIMLAPFDGKISLRLTHFETKMTNDASISPGGQASDVGQAVGGTNLVNIYNALYTLSMNNPYLARPSYNTGPVATPGGGSQPVGLDANGKGLGPMSPTTYGIAPPAYNAGLTNTYARGYELQLDANLTKNLTLRLNGSYTQRDHTAIMPEVLNFYNTNIPIWLNMACPYIRASDGAPMPTASDGTIPNPKYIPNPNSPDGIYYVNVRNPNGNPITGNDGSTITAAPNGVITLYDFLRNQLWEPDANQVILAGGTSGSVRQSIAQTLLNQSGPLGARTWKFNFVARYTFDDGWLKGFSIFPGVRYQSPAHASGLGNSIDSYLMPPDGTTDLNIDTSYYSDNKKMVTLNSLLFYDLGMAYRCKIFGGRTTMRLQLNIQNIFNNDIVTVARIAYNPADSQKPVAQRGIVWTRTYLNQPRSFRLTATFDF